MFGVEDGTSVGGVGAWNFTTTYTRSVDDASTELDLSFRELDEILSRREKARLQGDYDLSDELREQLRESGVGVDDNLKTWRGDFRQKMQIPSRKQYQRSTNDIVPIDEHTLVLIESLVSARAAAKVLSHFIQSLWRAMTPRLSRLFSSIVIP
jgi:hypothetical protein